MVDVDFNHYSIIICSHPLTCFLDSSSWKEVNCHCLHDVNEGFVNVLFGVGNCRGLQNKALSTIINSSRICVRAFIIFHCFCTDSSQSLCEDKKGNHTMLQYPIIDLTYESVFIVYGSLNLKQKRFINPNILLALVTIALQWSTKDSFESKITPRPPTLSHASTL